MRSALAAALAVAALSGAFFGTMMAQAAAVSAAVVVALLVDRRSLGVMLRVGVVLTVLFSSAVALALAASWRT